MERLGYWPRRGCISPIIKAVSRQPSQRSNGASSTFRVITGAETCACQRPGPGDSSGQTGLRLARPGGREGPLTLLWPPRAWVPADPQGHQMSLGLLPLLSGKMFGFGGARNGYIEWEGTLRQEATSRSQWAGLSQAFLSCARPMKWKDGWWCGGTTSGVVL